MFNEDPETEIYRVVVEATRRDGEVDKWRSETYGPYTSKPAAQGVLTQKKKNLDRMMETAERSEKVYGVARATDVVGYKARIEEGVIAWKAVDGSAVHR
jgi:hypothetical protein